MYRFSMHIFITYHLCSFVCIYLYMYLYVCMYVSIYLPNIYPSSLSSTHPYTFIHLLNLSMHPKLPTLPSSHQYTLLSVSPPIVCPSTHSFTASSTLHIHMAAHFPTNPCIHPTSNAVRRQGYKENLDHVPRFRGLLNCNKISYFFSFWRQNVHPHTLVLVNRANSLIHQINIDPSCAHISSENVLGNLLTSRSKGTNVSNLVSYVENRFLPEKLFGASRCR